MNFLHTVKLMAEPKFSQIKTGLENEASAYDRITGSLFHFFNPAIDNGNLEHIVLSGFENTEDGQHEPANPCQPG